LTVVSTGPSGAGEIASNDHMITCSAGSAHSCATSYPAGTEVTLAADINTGFALNSVNWPGCAPTSTTCTFRLTQDTLVDAAFTTGSYALTVTTTGHGTVTSTDGNIDCGATCSHAYAYQASITLTASPSGSFTFDHWSGGPCDSQMMTTCTMTMQAAPMTINATFHTMD
jgi:hypothetical protein